MKEILTKIFEISGYIKEEKKFTDKQILYFSIRGKEYYTICFVENLNYLTLNSLKKIIKKLNSKEFLSKEEVSNNTIIVCAEILESSINTSERNVIFNIEEDTIGFKKYVLWYTRDEIENFKSFYFNKISDYESMSKLICESHIEFENFKDGKYSEKIRAPKNELEYTEKELKNIIDIKRNMGYALLTRLFIKLPFLVLRYTPPLSENINDFIKKELENLKSGLSKVLNEAKISKEVLNSIDLDKKELKAIDIELSNYILE